MIQQLKAAGYDGLVSDNCYCSCKLGDLMPCEDSMDCVPSCQAGHVIPCPGPDECEFGGPDEGCTWHIKEGKR